MCTLYSFFSPRPSAVGYIVQPHTCHIIEHIFVPTRSVEGNIEKIRFLWVSNSKFMIFPQIYPCSNYKIFPNVPLLFPVSNGDSPVVTTFPRSNYRGFLTTGEYYCTMYTLCTGREFGRVLLEMACLLPVELCVYFTLLATTENTVDSNWVWSLDALSLAWIVCWRAARDVLLNLVLVF